MIQTFTIEQEVTTPWGIIVEETTHEYKVNLPVTFDTAVAFRKADQLRERAQAEAGVLVSPRGRALAAIAKAIGTRAEVKVVTWLNANHSEGQVRHWKLSHNNRGNYHHINDVFTPATANFGDWVGNANIYIDGAQINVALNETRDHISSWRSRPSGKYNVVIEVSSTKYNHHSGRNVPCTVRKSFPPRKNGSYNYAEIARLLLTEADRRATTIRLEQQRRQNEQVIPELKKELGLSEYNRQIQSSMNPNKPVFVGITVQQAMTVEQTKQLFAAIRTVLPEF